MALIGVAPPFKKKKKNYKATLQKNWILQSSFVVLKGFNPSFQIFIKKSFF